MGQRLKAFGIWFVGMFVLWMIEGYMDEQAITQALTFIAGMLTMFCIRVGVED